jgi:microcin C transport system permease protein
VGNISALLALDYLGFGLPTEVPSWGELIGQGKAQVTQWHLVVFPLLIVFITLELVVFIGEAVREAFDPKVFSRLR